MKSYTEMMETLAKEISDDDDDYTQSLQEAVSLFRNFDDVMDDFICEHGYTGKKSDIDEKTAFIQNKFKAAKIKAPRGIRGWSSEHKTIERDTAFRLAFAFGLGIDETCDLFKKICIGRCFDCHAVSEAVYYYCMLNGLSYADAEDIIAKVPKDVKGKITDGEVLYTGNIINDLHQIGSKDELVNYLTQNAEGFGYNNAAATKYIQTLWQEIAGENGLAYRNSDLKPNSSVWDIYLHILGLDDMEMKKNIAELNIDRSLKPILKDNKLLHPLAAASFPDREGINRILNGEHLSYERVRKLLILLLFYRFWEQRCAKEMDYEEKERCIADINGYLLDVGYPELYCGNPYDWIFYWSLQAYDPLQMFQFFIGELFAVKSESAIESKM